MAEIEGFLHAKEVELLAAEAAKVPSGGCIVEVGSYLGKSTVAMAAAVKPNVTLWAIDTWDNRAMGKLPQHDTFERFLFNVRDYGNVIVPLRGESKEAAKDWNVSIDLLFIDADHSYEAVLNDLDAWVPHLKQGGTMIMHDYTEKSAGVAEAFAAYRVTCPRSMRMHVIASCLKVEA